MRFPELVMVYLGMELDDGPGSGVCGLDLTGGAGSLNGSVKSGDRRFLPGFPATLLSSAGNPLSRILVVER